MDKLYTNYSSDIFIKEIKLLKGVGSKYAEILKKKNIKTIYDLIAYYPRTYEDRRKTLTIYEALNNNKEKNSVVLVEIIDITKFTFNYKNKPLIIASDGHSICEIPIYGGRMPAGVAKGEKLYLTGKFIRSNRGKIQCRMVELEKPNNNSLSYGKIVPIYPLTEGLSQKKLRTLIVSELENFENNMKYDIPSIIKKKYRLKSFVSSVIEMHFPTSFDALDISKESLIFEEFLTFQYIHLSERRPNILVKNIRYKSYSLLEQVKSNLTFQLTEDQENVIEDIKNDLLSTKQMFRLLQGDVGAGKTIVAFLTALIPTEENLQTAFLVPTEILAIQHLNK